MSQPNRIARPGQIAVLDIGGNKSVCFAGDLAADGRMEVKGIGHMLSRGLRGGVITDAAEVETSVVTAVNTAEEMADMQVSRVLVSLNMPQIRSRHLTLDLNLSRDAISERDVQYIMNEARQTVLEGEALLHVVPYRFDLDGQKGIRDPRGMVGQKLSVNLLLVTAPANVMRNLTHCLGRCHLEVEAFVAAAYAAGLACLEEDEKELGVTLLDMGAYATSYAVFSGGRLVHTGAVGIGSHHITQDVAQGLNTGIQQAERLKTVHGGAVVSSADDAVMVDVYPIGAESEEEAVQEKRSHLNRIIRPRIEEVFEMTREALDAANLGKLSGSRLVLTGGGSQLLGVAELASRMFDRQVRLATPRRVEGLADATSGPAFSAPIGLLKYATLLRGNQAWMHVQRAGNSPKSLKQMLRWFKENF